MPECSRELVADLSELGVVVDEWAPVGRSLQMSGGDGLLDAGIGLSDDVRPAVPELEDLGARRRGRSAVWGNRPRLGHLSD